MSPRLPHGYTNSTRRLPSGHVEKCYEGIDGAERWRREVICLSRIGGAVPVPELLQHDREALTIVIREATGRHGQELIDESDAHLVMALVGSTLRKLQGVSVDTVAGIPGEGTVIVHGDFGPQNMLFDLSDGGRVTCLFDWEFAHIGDPIEDLAWAEWIVRMHHPRQVDAVQQLLSRGGISASWSDRHAAMVRRCDDLRQLACAAGSAATEKLWHKRLTDTEGWTGD